MIERIVSLVTLALMACVAVFYEFGMISPRDAFFVASAIVIVFTGQQIMAREHFGFREAARQIATKPSSYANRTSFASYVACIALGLVITSQIVSQS